MPIIPSSIPVLPAGTSVVGTSEGGITATGTNAGTAYVLTKQVNFVATTASGTGVILFDLPQVGAGAGSISPIVIRNAGANTLTIYMPTGHTINGSGNSQTLSANQTVLYFKEGATNWIGIKA